MASVSGNQAFMQQPQPPSKIGTHYGGTEKLGCSSVLFWANFGVFPELPAPSPGAGCACSSPDAALHQTFALWVMKWGWHMMPGVQPGDTARQHGVSIECALCSTSLPRAPHGDLWVLPLHVAVL